MSFVATWGRPMVGYLALQHTGYDEFGYDLPSRASLRAVRVLNRDSDTNAADGVGSWVLDDDCTGDIVGFLCWPAASREMPGWSQVWPAMSVDAGEPQDPGVPTVDQRRPGVVTGDVVRPDVPTGSSVVPPTNPSQPPAGANAGMDFSPGVFPPGFFEENGAPFIR